MSLLGLFTLSGPVGDACDGCVCEAGEVTCLPPACPRIGLTCVDPVREDNCCFSCPNGKSSIIISSRTKFLHGQVFCCGLCLWSLKRVLWHMGWSNRDTWLSVCAQGRLLLISFSSRG